MKKEAAADEIASFMNFAKEIAETEKEKAEKVCPCTRVDHVFIERRQNVACARRPVRWRTPLSQPLPPHQEEKALQDTEERTDMAQMLYMNRVARLLKVGQC